MRIRSQYLISITIFVIVLAIIATSVVITQQQTSLANNKETIAMDIQTRASNLAYLSNDYFLYQEDSQLILWQSEFSSLSDDLSKFSTSGSIQQTLLNNVRGDAQRLNSVWTDVVSYLENAPRNVSVRILPAFQTDWSRMAVQNQALAFGAQQLSQSVRSQVDQLNLTNTFLILAFLGLFGAYFITNYMITYRNTLKSISDLQKGIQIIGSGNLDSTLKEEKGSEISEISKSINQMVANLKTVTASKTELEKEISERKKAEEQANEAERFAAIGKTAAMVGHDLRNPLQAIVGHVGLAEELLERMNCPSEEKNEFRGTLKKLNDLAFYMNKIVSDLQDYARPLNLMPIKTDLSKLIEETLSTCKIPPEMSVSILIPKNLHSVTLDSSVIRRVLTNLVTNGVQAMPEGGKLTVRVFEKKDPRMISISVEDTGIGMSKAARQQVFTPLFTTKSKGQGFGLAVCKRLVEAHGGTITFRSQLGKGTKFVIHIPVDQKENVNSR
jgi:signal transduction histidine kinase